MSQPPESLPESTPSATPEVVDPLQVPSEVLTALGRAVPPVQTAGGPPVWTSETNEAVRRIHEIITARCPGWAWACWPFTPTSEQAQQALIDGGFQSYDKDGKDVAYDPDGTAAAKLQTVNWDAHYTGEMADATKARVVSDGRPENGGIFPIISIGPPNAEEHGEDIAMMLESWTRRYAVQLPNPATMPAPTAKSNGSGSTPVSGVMAWACDLCQTVVRQGADGTMPTFVCPGCGATQRWRQPTMDELANVSPAERAALSGAQPYALGLPAQQRQGDNDFYAQQGAQPPPQGGQYAQPNFAPDPETRALVEGCWLLESISPEARQRVLRYFRERWS